LTRIIFENVEMAVIRENLKKLNNRQLLILEEIIRRERKKRQQSVFNEWLAVLKTIQVK